MVIGKRETKRLARRANIIAVAREHFFEHGYAGTVMSAIAADLGGSKATLWRHFPSKEALLTAVVEDAASAFQRRTNTPNADAAPVTRLISLCRTMVDNAISPLFVAMCRLMYYEAVRQPELARIFHDRGTLRGRKELAKCLEQEFGDLLKPTDLMEAARVLLSLCSSGLHADILSGVRATASGAERDVDARRAAEVFLWAYAKDPEALWNAEFGCQPAS